MKRVFALFLVISLVAAMLCGCKTSVSDNYLSDDVTVIVEEAVDSDTDAEEENQDATSNKPSSKSSKKSSSLSSDTKAEDDPKTTPKTSSRKKVITGSSSKSGSLAGENENTNTDEGDEPVIEKDENFDMDKLPAKTDKTVRMLVIGNSYSENTTQFVSRIGESIGVDVSVCALYFAGCLISQHVDFYNAKSPNYTLYEDGVAIKTNCTMQDAFAYQEYDYVAMLQSPTGCDQWSWYNGYIQALNDIVKLNEPQAKRLIHQNWAFSDAASKGGHDYYKVNYANSDEMFAAVEDCYNKAATACGLNPTTDVIPIGKAIQLAKAEPYNFGDFHNAGAGSDIAKQLKNGALYADNVNHLNYRGSYIGACVIIEKVFGVDCRNSTYYLNGYITKEECATLREIAHKAVNG